MDAISVSLNLLFRFLPGEDRPKWATDDAGRLGLR